MGSLDDPKKQGPMSNVARLLNPRNKKEGCGESMPRHYLNVETHGILIHPKNENSSLLVFTLEGGIPKAFLKKQFDDKAGVELRADPESGEFVFRTADKKWSLGIRPQAIHQTKDGHELVFQAFTSPAIPKDQILIEFVRIALPE